MWIYLENQPPKAWVQSSLTLSNFKVYHQSFQLYLGLAQQPLIMCLMQIFREETCSPQKIGVHFVLWQKIQELYVALWPYYCQHYQAFQGHGEGFEGGLKMVQWCPLVAQHECTDWEQAIGLKTTVWSLKGFHVPGDLHDGKGVLSFQDLKDHFDQQDSSSIICK